MNHWAFGPHHMWTEVETGDIIRMWQPFNGLQVYPGGVGTCHLSHVRYLTFVTIHLSPVTLHLSPAILSLAPCFSSSSLVTYHLVPQVRALLTPPSSPTSPPRCASPPPACSPGGGSAVMTTATPNLRRPGTRTGGTPGMWSPRRTSPEQRRRCQGVTTRVSSSYNHAMSRNGLW
jgi:hypothetical protein